MVKQGFKFRQSGPRAYVAASMLYRMLLVPQEASRHTACSVLQDFSRIDYQIPTLLKKYDPVPLPLSLGWCEEMNPDRGVLPVV